MDLVGLDSLEKLRSSHNGWVEDIISDDNLGRESMWTESIAVGSEHFVEATRKELAGQAKGRKLIESGGAYELRETQTAYLRDFAPKNAYSWNDYQ